MKKHVLTITLTIITACLFGQSDCVIFFRYKGIIVSDSIKIQKIGLPTTPYIVGYEKKSGSKAFAIYNINDTSFNFEMASHLSSDFCGAQEDIVNFVFKRIQEYPIKLFRFQKKPNTETKLIEIIIPIDSIRFTCENINDRKEIIIDLGHIKT